MKVQSSSKTRGKTHSLKNVRMRLICWFGLYSYFLLKFGSLKWTHKRQHILASFGLSSPSQVNYVYAHWLPKLATCNISRLLYLKEGLLDYKVNLSQLCGHCKHMDMSTSIRNIKKEVKVIQYCSKRALLRLGHWSSCTVLTLKNYIIWSITLMVNIYWK